MTGHFQCRMTQEFLEHKRIAAAINEVFTGESMAEKVEGGFLYTPASVIALNGKAEGIGGQHFAVFITEKVITISAAARFAVIPQNTNHLRTEGDYLNFVRFGMPEYDPTIGKINIPVLDIANRSRAAPAVHQKIDDDPITILTEGAILFWPFQ